MMNAPSTETQTNQYGFYAIPKAVEPRRKYRETENDQYQDNQQQDEQKFIPIDRQPINQKQLDRDYYVDEAPYPQFKPKQRGLDYGVQIQRGDLFDYNVEVNPLIQILVGRSIVTAINELQEQKEQNERRQNLDIYQKRRNAQLMVTQRMQAKNKRKIQQSNRRLLQKDVYVKNKKALEAKLLSRIHGKRILRNLKQDLFLQLEQQGYLRDTPILTLKIHYQNWLYQMISEILKQQRKVKQEINKMIEDEQQQKKKQHKKNIDKQLERRKLIMDQRQRIRRQNQQRKIKKKIRKQRLKLNEQRKQKSQQFYQLIQKYQAANNKILKQTDNISNGLTKGTNTKPTLYISGGLLNFILVYLNSLKQPLNQQQIENILEKILVQIQGKLQVNVRQQHYQIIQKYKKQMQQQPINFMTNKQQKIQQLSNLISLQISFIQSMGINIQSQLHRNLIKIFLKIYLNIIPQQKEGQPIFQLNIKDKKRQQIRSQLNFIANQQSQNINNRLQSINSLLRVHFERILKQEQEPKQNEEQNKQKQNQQKQINLDEWIDIFDGQRWIKQGNQIFEEYDKNNQTSTIYNLTPFDNSFVFDERNLYYLQRQLENLLKLECNQNIEKYFQEISNIKNKIKKSQKDIAVYDAQIYWPE